ncbi:MAG: T9SS type A sorting domain-containing protein [Bacteroidota bacterium]
MNRLIGFILALLLFSPQIHSQSKDTTTQRHTSSVIQFSTQQGDTAVVTVYSLLGKYLTKKSFHRSGSFRLSLNAFHLPAGIYLVQIKTAHKSIVKKAFVLP